ncbi:MAG TPA: alpha/beta hydrolase [Candidatus Acidoferrales bacterium]
MTPASVTVPQRTSRSRRYVGILLVVLAVIYVSACAFFSLQQDQMTFPAPREYATATPLNASIPFEDLHIPVNGSEQIHAWWIPASSASGKVLLVFHGNGYVLEQAARGELVPLHALGTNLLMIDYRGYGSSSPGSPNEKRVYEDARAAFSYLTVQRRVRAQDIIFLGRSIGSGPAVEMAKEHPEAGGLILISAFTSTIDSAKTIWFLRPFPLSLLSHNRFDNLSKMDAVHLPVFIAVGTEDRLTPPAMARALFRRANEPKRFYLSPGADHNGMLSTEVTALEAQISAFLQTIQ